MAGRERPRESRLESACLPACPTMKATAAAAALIRYTSDTAPAAAAQFTAWSLFLFARSRARVSLMSMDRQFGGKGIEKFSPKSGSDFMG